MVLRERALESPRTQARKNKDRQTEWKTPRGRDIREVSRDATGQVIDRYSEALKKLKDH